MPYNNQPKNITPAEALARLEALCSRSEQSTFDVKARMRRWHIAPENIEKIVRRLRKNRYIDDARFASAFVNDKVRLSRWGIVKVRLQLAARKIDSNSIEDAIAEIDSDEYEQIALDVIRQRIRLLSLTDSPENRRKIYRYGIGRGFETSIMARMVKNPCIWLNENDGDEDDIENENEMLR